MYVGNKQTLSTDASIHINHLPVRGRLTKIAAPTISITGKGRYSEDIAAPLNATTPVQATSQRNSRFRLLAIKSLETQWDFIEHDKLPQIKADFRAQALSLRDGPTA